MTNLKKTEILRYQRHFNLPGIGLEGQKQLRRARVLCVGAGGLGCAALPYLAAAGIGQLGIIDEDNVELSNLQRQVLFSTQDLLQNKATVAKAKLSALNPDIHIASYDYNLTESNALKLISQYDIVLDCTDNHEARYLINDACYELNKPFIYASIYQFEGLCSSFSGKLGPCYRCLFPQPPSENLLPNCATAGVLGVLPGILGCIAATETIKNILQLGESLTGHLLQVDVLTMTFKNLTLTMHPNCPLCIEQQGFMDLERPQVKCQPPSKAIAAVTPIQLKHMLDTRQDFLLVDVREPYEHDICQIDPCFLLPLSDLKQRYLILDEDKKIIIYCKSDVRSQQAAAFLQQQGFTDISFLQGGILAWIKQIQPELMQY
ncbi:MAG: molybdopterin-synthase adenylyltransferase MoeB [Pseudomonadota bacterium]